MEKQQQHLKVIESESEIFATINFLEPRLSHPIDRNIWRWEFERWPELTVTTVIKNEAQLVMGAQFMMPVVLVVDDIELLTGKSENSHLHTDLRGQGLFEKLYDLAIENCKVRGMKYLWGFTPATKVFGNKLNFQVFENTMYNISVPVGIPAWCIIRQANKNMMVAIAKLCFHASRNLMQRVKYKLFLSKTMYHDKIVSFQVTDELRAEHDMLNLYAVLKKRYSHFTHILLNTDYMQWRIKNNNSQHYIAKFFYTDDALAGYYIFAKKNNAANLADFTATDEDTGKVMLAHLLECVGHENITELNYFGNMDFALNKNTFDMLMAIGVRPQLQPGMPFVLKNICAESTHDHAMAHSANFYINGLWTEGFVF